MYDKLACEIDKPRWSANLMLFHHYGYRDWSSHIYFKISRRDFVDNHFFFRWIFLYISSIVEYISSISYDDVFGLGDHVICMYILVCIRLAWILFLLVSPSKDRSAIHFDRWSRARLVFQGIPGSNYGPARITGHSFSLALPSAFSRSGPGSNFRSVGGQYVGCQTASNTTYTRFYTCSLPCTAKIRAITRQLVPIFRRKLWHDLVLHGFYVNSAKLEYGRGDIAIIKNWLHDLNMIYEHWCLFATHYIVAIHYIVWFARLVVILVHFIFIITTLCDFWFHFIEERFGYRCV